MAESNGKRPVLRALAGGLAGGLAGLFLHGPAVALPSHCAALPESAEVMVQPPDRLVPAELTSRGMICPRGFTMEKADGKDRCRQPVAAVRESRQPRAACHAALALGPVEAEGPVPRPAMRCQTAPRMTATLALRGPNAGWEDLTLTASPGASVILEPVGDAEEGGAHSRDCFPHDCRLVRITTRTGTPPRFDLLLATPGKGASTPVRITTEAMCPSH
ncbi:hypothetical protein ACUJ46_08660 [Sandaracinobacteroides sp. A072]|uniref:hypothetical protein n=1 Tax=Sandaracinobacteroides sp. A072 TaxID=3461146 RepID=UPI0040433E5B